MKTADPPAQSVDICTTVFCRSPARRMLTIRWRPKGVLVDRDIIGACGLLCSSCEAFLATQANARAEIEAIATQWTARYSVAIEPDDVWCDGCMTSGAHLCRHADDCEIRACVVRRDLQTCADCTHYICDTLDAFLDKTAGFGTRERLEGLRPIF